MERRKFFLTAFQRKEKAEHLLTDAGIAGQGVGIFLDGKAGWTLVVNPQHSTPFPKVSTVSLVLSTALREAIKSCKSEKSDRATVKVKFFLALLFS